MRTKTTNRFTIEEGAVPSAEQIYDAHVLVPSKVKKFLSKGTTVTLGTLAESLKYCNRDAVKIVLNRMADEGKIGLLMQGDAHTVISGPYRDN